MELHNWINDGVPDRWRARGRVVDFVGLAFILVVFFALSFVNAVFHLKLEKQMPDIRNYSRHSAEPYDETREPLIRAW